MCCVKYGNDVGSVATTEEGNCLIKHTLLESGVGAPFGV